MRPDTEKEPATNQFQRVQHVQVSDQQHDRRVDNFLISLLHLPKSRVYRMIRKGEVRVNKKRVKSDYRVQTGDTVRIPPVFQEATEQVSIPAHINQRLEDAILYEDEQYLIINKPSGIPVHAGSGLRFGVIEAFKAHVKFKDQFIELAHRLDRDTSGCLLLVKQPKALKEVHSLLTHNETEKRYLTLLKGPWKGGSHIIDLPLKKSQARGGKTKEGGERFVTVAKDGKLAKSEFHPISSNEVCSLVEVRLYTGRTHQIRVHAASMGMPVAGDQKYGDEEFNKKMREFGLKRLFLHAKHLAFQPGDSAKLSFDAPLDDHLQTVLIKTGLIKP